MTDKETNCPAGFKAEPPLHGESGVRGVLGRDVSEVLVPLSRLFSRASNTSSEMDSSTVALDDCC